VFDEFIAKGGSMGTKLIELFANQVVERRNIINNYLRGEFALRVLGRVDFRGGADFELLILSVCLGLSFS
jgi:hypothetical protein